MFMNTNPMSLAERVSLVSVVLLPLASLAGNAVADIILVINILVFLFLSRKNIKSYLHSWFLRLSIVFWIWILLCSAVSLFPAHSFQDSLPWIRFPLYAFALSFILGLQNERHLKYFMYAAILGTAVQLTFMLHEYGSDRIDPARLHGVSGKLNGGWYLDCFSLMAIFWLIDLVRKKNSTFQTLLTAILFTALASYTVIITGEIMSTLFFAGGVILYLIFYAWHSKGKIGLILLAIFAPLSITVSFNLLSIPLQQRIIYSITKRLPWLETSDYYGPWKSGIMTAIQNPIFGVGPKNFNFYCLDLKNRGLIEKILNITECVWHPHNLDLQILSESGIIGLLLFVSIAAYIVVLSYKHARITQWENYTPLIFSVILFFPIQTYSQAFGQSKNFYFWTTLGYILYRLRNQLRESGNDASL